MSAQPAIGPLILLQLVQLQLQRVLQAPGSQNSQTKPSLLYIGGIWASERKGLVQGHTVSVTGWLHLSLIPGNYLWNRVPTNIQSSDFVLGFFFFSCRTSMYELYPQMGKLRSGKGLSQVPPGAAKERRGCLVLGTWPSSVAELAS